MVIREGLDYFIARVLDPEHTYPHMAMHSSIVHTENGFRGEPCSFGRSLSTRLAGRIINHFCMRYAIVLCPFDYCHLLQLYVKCAALYRTFVLGYAMWSSARDKIPSDPVVGRVWGMVIGQGPYKQKSPSHKIWSYQGDGR